MLQIIRHRLDFSLALIPRDGDPEDLRLMSVYQCCIQDHLIAASPALVRLLYVRVFTCFHP